VDAWTSFIRRELRTSADIWNVSQYIGGFNIQGSPESVLSKYANKVIMALDHDCFKFCDKRIRGTLDFISPGPAWSLSRNGIQFLFAQNRRQDRLREIAFSPALGSSRMPLTEGHIFGHTKDFLSHLHTDRGTCDECGQSEVFFFVKCYRSKLARKGRRITKILRK
jgi:hypothetical protein